MNYLLLLEGIIEVCQNQPDQKMLTSELWTELGPGRPVPHHGRHKRTGTVDWSDGGSGGGGPAVQAARFLKTFLALSKHSWEMLPARPIGGKVKRHKMLMAANYPKKVQLKAPERGIWCFGVECDGSSNFLIRSWIIYFWFQRKAQWTDLHVSFNKREDVTTVHDRKKVVKKECEAGVELFNQLLVLKMTRFMTHCFQRVPTLFYPTLLCLVMISLVKEATMLRMSSLNCSENLKKTQ